MTVGHAIVDLLAPVADSVVEGFGLAKGTMTLVDAERSEVIYRSLPTTTAMSGGSAANTAVGIADLGAPVAFLGKVRDDELGEVFTRDIRAAGVGFDVPMGTSGPPTGRCMIMVTDDAEKTMCTNLGIGDFLQPGDIDAEAVAGAEVVYLEGYLCGLHSTDPTVERAVSAAQAAGTLVAMSLSDPLWVELHRSDLDPLLDRVDLLFANADEARTMVGTNSLDDAVAALAERCATVVVTCGPDGALVAAGGARTRVEATPVERVVDTTGAGDLFAAGYLYGVVNGFHPRRCARLGCLVAAEVIGHLGARPASPLTDMVTRSAD